MSKNSDLFVCESSLYPVVVVAQAIPIVCFLCNCYVIDRLATYRVRWDQGWMVIALGWKVMRVERLQVVL